LALTAAWTGAALLAAWLVARGRGRDVGEFI
jgi:hypothetical protein